MERRKQFVAEYRSGDWTMTELCRAHGISRPTGYEVLRRYERDGELGLEGQSRAPQRHPNQTPREMEEQVLGLRRVHPRWGPRTLKSRLEKLWFRTRDGTRIDPLTITDACSRYLLRCQAVEKTDTARVQAIFEAAFRESGMPLAIRTDNGAPFASRAIAGLSWLAVWWMKLGIVPERIQAGHPEQNGQHERMHRTLGEETVSPPQANARAQQRAFDDFRYVFNEERPHQALGMQTPSSCYVTSPRPYPARVPEPEYGSALRVRRVDCTGHFSWKHENVFLSETLSSGRVGLLPIDERYYRVYFADFPMARFDSHHLRIERLPKDEPAAD